MYIYHICIHPAILSSASKCAYLHACCTNNHMRACILHVCKSSVHIYTYLHIYLNVYIQTNTHIYVYMHVYVYLHTVTVPLECSPHLCTSCALALKCVAVRCSVLQLEFGTHPYKSRVVPSQGILKVLSKIILGLIC